MAVLGSRFEPLYVDAVGTWLDDPTPRSTQILFELEYQADAPELNRIGEAQQRVFSELARINPDALIPLATLHRQLYQRHLDADAELQAKHSAQRIRDLVDLFVGRVRTQEARAAAARQWSGLGVSLLAQGGAQLSPAIACFREALSHVRLRRANDEMRAERVRALHLRAIIHERMGAPPKALDDLGDLLAIDSDHVEARLREAVNLMQDERLEDAEPKLRSLAQLEEPSWAAVIASQQLARLLVDVGRQGEATEVLRTAVKRFPQNARLGVMLAYNQRPQWQAAQARVAGLLESWTTAEPMRPRVRYEIPADDDRELFGMLEKDLESRLDAAYDAVTEWGARRGK